MFIFRKYPQVKNKSCSMWQNTISRQSQCTKLVTHSKYSNVYYCPNGITNILLCYMKHNKLIIYLLLFFLYLIVSSILISLSLMVPWVKTYLTCQGTSFSRTGMWATWIRSQRSNTIKCFPCQNTVSPLQLHNYHTYAIRHGGWSMQLRWRWWMSH